MTEVKHEIIDVKKPSEEMDALCVSRNMPLYQFTVPRHYKLHQNLLGFLSKSKISEEIPSMF
jgi:hypothetical protein